MARVVTIDVMHGGGRVRLHVSDRAPYVYIPPELCNAKPFECAVAAVENIQSRKEDLTTLPNYRKGYFDE